MDNPTDYCLEQLSKRGFDKAQIHHVINERDELQAELGKISLFRTVVNDALVLTGLVNDKRASTTINTLDKHEISLAIDSLWLSAQASIGDDANEISEAQPSETFHNGSLESDHEAMYARLDEFLDYTASTYPTVTLGSASVSHLRSTHTHANSNGVRFESSNGCYQYTAHFSAKEGQDVSSLNGSYALSYDATLPIATAGTFDVLLKSTVEQVRTRKLESKFVGDLIMTPDSVSTFFGFLVDNIGRGPMVAGTSVYKDKIGEQVACQNFSLHAQPCTRPGGCQVTDDCYPAEDLTVVKGGVLQSYLLDLFAARKTGLARSRNTGGWYSIDAGKTPLEQMIAKVDKGILIGRFSGGQPSAKGDFSGVAKNSYYIENGVIQYPISETMISGNMASLLLDITAISIERADYGRGALPWMSTSGITVS